MGQGAAVSGPRSKCGAGPHGVALITGAGRGIGRELARQLAGEGWRVYAGVRNEGAGAGLEGEGQGRVTAVRLEVTDEGQARAAAERVMAGEGRLDLLIHNAGIFAEGEEGLATVDSARMLRVYHVNAVAPVVLTRIFLPLLEASGGAKIFTLTSGAGVLRRPDPGMWGGAGGQFSYGASKAALHMATRRLAAELRPRGIGVYGMAPGFVLTDMTRASKAPPPLRVEESAAGMRAVMARLTLEDTGRFYSYDGGECDWYPA